MPPTHENHLMYTRLAQAMSGQQTDLSGIAGDQLLDLSLANGVAALLAYRHSKGSVTGFEDKTVKKLSEIAHEQAAHDLILNHATRNVFERLAIAGLRCLALKGAPLAQLAYPKTYLRERCDTDLYVAVEDVEAVATSLSAGGFTIDGLNMRPQASKQFQASTRSFQQIDSTFDIHYRLSNRVMFRATLPFEECWASRQPITTLGEHAQALSNTDLLIHACIHRIAHGRGSERNRLIWLYDIHLLWTSMDEQEQAVFIEKALAKKVGAVCADALNVCDELFGTLAVAADQCGSGFSREQEKTTASHSRLKPLPQTTPDTTLNALLKNQADEPTAPLINAGKLRWAWADLKATTGLRAKLQLTKELLQNQL